MKNYKQSKFEFGDTEALENFILLFGSDYFSIGYNNDDFIRNIITVIIEFKDEDKKENWKL